MNVLLICKDDHVYIVGAWTTKEEAEKEAEKFKKPTLVFDYMDRPLIVCGVIRRWAMGLGFLLECEEIANRVLGTLNKNFLEVGI